ncbi:MAG: hypothetical protein JW709_05700 [Sedimentisphaerales bacterium]|nr:hypothetical protein [Sedimentisphaerales bacterium]
MKKLRFFIGIAAVSFALAGLWIYTNQHTSGPSNDKTDESSEQPAYYNPGENPLAIITIEYGESTPPRTVYLLHDYGFCIKWMGDGPPGFYIYDKPAHKITAFTDFSEFLNALKAFPDQTRFDWIHGCCAPFSCAMPETEHQKLEDVIDVKKFTFFNNEVVCYCESKRILFHKGNNESDVIETLLYH